MIFRPLVLGAALVGCGAPATPDAAPPRPPAIAPRVVATALPSAAPSSNPREAEAPSPFHVAVRGGDFEVRTIGSRTFVVPERGAGLLEITEAGFEPYAEFERAFEKAVHFSQRAIASHAKGPGHLFGSRLDGLFASSLVVGARSSQDTLYRWSGTAFVVPRGGAQVESGVILDTVPWKKSWFAVVWHWPGRRTIFQPLAGTDPGPEPERADDGTRLVHACDVAALPGGQLIVAGGDGDDRLVVERFSETSPRSAFDVVADNAGQDVLDRAKLAGTSADDLYLAAGWSTHGRHHLAHFDGKAWTAIATPFKGAISDAARADDGTLWLVVDKAVWTFRPPASWQRVALPGDGDKPFAASRVFTPHGAGVWIAGPDALLRLGDAKPPRDWTPPEQPMGVEPASTHCPNKNFVLLYTLLKSTPRDYDFPQLRAALKGQTELTALGFAETEDAGRHYLVAFVNDEYETRTGARLIDLVKKNVKSSSPIYLCGDPNVVRELHIDLKTGELAK